MICVPAPSALPVIYVSFFSSSLPCFPVSSFFFIFFPFFMPRITITATAARISRIGTVPRKPTAKFESCTDPVNILLKQHFYSFSKSRSRCRGFPYYLINIQIHCTIIHLIIINPQPGFIRFNLITYLCKLCLDRQNSFFKTLFVISASPSLLFAFSYRKLCHHCMDAVISCFLSGMFKNNIITSPRFF